MNLDKEIEETIGYLNSDEALASIDRDPYWPKWDTPWWRVLVLYELGLVHRVPQRLADHLVERIDRHYYKEFPLSEAEVPDGIDPCRNIPCHCALGGIYQALAEYGIAVDERLPWIRPWFLRYQLPDGGLNCDEQAYGNSNKSSVLSTLPALEAILNYAPNGLTSEEEAFVDSGAEYIMNHRLVHRSSFDQPMHPSFLKLSFPRFYDYDFLRGTNFLIRWQQVRGKTTAQNVIELGLDIVRKKRQEGSLVLEKISYDEKETLRPGKDGNWDWGPQVLFPLLEKVSGIGLPPRFLHLPA